jgi:Fe-S-cluster containining protein
MRVGSMPLMDWIWNLKQRILGKPWISFECKRCGACCSPQWRKPEILPDGSMRIFDLGEFLIVREPDKRKVEKFLGISPKQLFDDWKFCGGNRDLVKILEKPCIYLSKDSNGLATCNIHPARPWGCASGPAHDSWRSIGDCVKISGRCPGLEVHNV